MQDNALSSIETFKCAIPAPRTPDRSLILPATPLQEVPEYRAERLHRARYDAVLTDYKPRDFRAFLMLCWLVFLLCWGLFLFLAWRFL